MTTLRDPSQLKPLQITAVEWQTQRKHSTLWLDYGFGKTVITLTSINHLIAKNVISKVLIVAPLRVIHLVWRQEALKWSHTQHLKFSTITGNQYQRFASVTRDADIYLINYENLHWLCSVFYRYYKKRNRSIPFDGLVWDEIVRCKNPNSKRVKSVFPFIDQFKWITGLTGGPAPAGYMDLFGQFLVCDGGQSLGTELSTYRTRYFNLINSKYYLKENAQSRIHQRINQVTLRAKIPWEEVETRQNPPVTVEIELSESLKSQYEQLERELYLKLDNGIEITPDNAGVLTGKCLQFCNGSIWHTSENPQWESVHSLKLEALQEIIDSSNSPVLCAYSFRPDATRIMRQFRKLKPVNLSDCQSQTHLEYTLNHWKSGNCQLMIGHPGSMGEGIDGLQSVCHTAVWFGLPWRLDYYLQFNARLNRTGQKETVNVIHILARNTIDRVTAQVLKHREVTETTLKNAMEKHKLQTET
ncbi:MAG: DEAD/DEAH box helicase family protein [Candidatus Thiodiazotropha endolucinida]|nr:DEAD/DEAH box helicase family protein [Candidatus Thiodiazotropha taylori]MCW4344856.1 DEAD/DEAH box helicase family protein [Candidatus Thiodiazotropha endolucinida]